MLACSGGNETAKVDQDTAAPDAATELEPIAVVPPELVAELLEPFHGDFATLVERRTVRALVVYNKTNFFLDGGTQRGITAEFLREFETALNKELKLGSRPLRVMAIPVARDQLLPYLEEGRGDIAAASLTITPERSKTVDFSIPGADEVSEVVVTGPGSPAVATLDDLAGKEVFIRLSSSYHESLELLNTGFRERGLEEIVVNSCERISGDRGPPRDGQRGPDRDHRRRRLSGGFLGPGASESRRAHRRRGPHRSEDRVGNPPRCDRSEGQGRPVRKDASVGHATRQHAPQALPAGHEVRQERPRRRRAPEAPGGRRPVPHVWRLNTTSTT